MATANAAIGPMAPSGMFEKKLPAQLILASFPLLTIPVIAIQAFASDHRLLFLYIWLFGLTHFVLTLSVYLQSENLKHFRATAQNVVLFFVVPLAILMGFYAVRRLTAAPFLNQQSFIISYALAAALNAKRTS